MAFTAVTALVAAETVTATMVLAAVAQVGTALTIVGAVTGSKDLMKLGGTMALVGGIGGMAAGAMSGAAAAEATATTVLDEASSQAGADALTASLEQGANAMATGVTDAATAQVGSDALAQQLDRQALGQVGAAGQASGASGLSTGGQMAMDNSAVATAADAGVATPMGVDVSTPYSTSGANNPSAWNGDATQRVANDYLGSQKVNSDNWFTSLLKNAKPDTLLQMGGNVLGGVAKGYEAERNYQLGEKRLGLIQQQQNWGNSTPKYNFKA